jgi:phage repressor protein C with HTH and peptisase S24 domain
MALRNAATVNAPGLDRYSDKFMSTESIAFATDNQVAKALVAPATFKSMDEKEIQAWRMQRLEAMVDREGGKAAAGRKLGYRDGAFVGQMLRGERPITEKTVLAAHALSGYSGWFDAQDSAVKVPVMGASPAPIPGEAIVLVPLLANSGSMGTGTDVQHEDVLVGHISLSQEWVARRLQPSSSAALRFIHAYGDSMHPTFEDGDVLLVDTGMRDPKAIDGVYVMAANDRVYIKRVRQRMDGAIEVSSDNPTVKTVDVLNGGQAIDVLGRVIWAWNGRKL